MKTRQIGKNIVLFFDAAEQDAAQLIGSACEQSASVITETWGFQGPKRCRVYVMTSWVNFVLHSSGRTVRIVLIILFPFLSYRFKRTWAFTAGWTAWHKDGPVIGIKPPRLYEQADTTIGAQIYVKEASADRKVQHAVCHELAHAFSAHLKPPWWLYEGIAMVTVDTFVKAQTVRDDTLHLLDHPLRKRRQISRWNLHRAQPKEIVYNYARAYWITRFLLETHPSLLPDLLKRRQTRRSLENRIAAAFNMSRQAFWETIDAAVISHFSKPSQENVVVEEGPCASSETP